VAPQPQSNAHAVDTGFKRNRWTFGIGTIGRDACYTLISMFMIFYFQSVLKVHTPVLVAISIIAMAWRFVDAVSDPLMGFIVDNTRSKWGKHKPWIVVGAFLSGILTILIFVQYQLSDVAFVVVFAIIYILWSATYSLNDVAYWSYVPALSTDQKERENIGSKARIFAMIGTFVVVGSINLVTPGLGGGDQKRGYMVFAIIVIVVMWLGQCVTLFGVKEPQGNVAEQPRTSLREFGRAIFKNDQLLYIAIATALFMIGYTTTTSFGTDYFTYIYGNVPMYTVFAVILAISQIGAMIAFPHVAKHFSRKTIYFWSTVLVVVGYVLFFFAPTNTMAFVGISGVLIFVGQGGIQILMLMFLADTVDYGHWKLGKRNESVTFALQPFVNKVGGAAATGITGLVGAAIGLNNPDITPAFRIDGSNLIMFKCAMFVLPLVCIVAGYLLYHFKYKIDEKTYAKIHEDLVARGELKDVVDNA
jgi:melibiose permease/lactose/raffinose/galactose permease